VSTPSTTARAKKPASKKTTRKKTTRGIAAAATSDRDLEELHGNGAALAISESESYEVHMTLRGVSRLMFHRWDGDLIDYLAGLPRGHAAKKIDYPDQYIWRDDKNRICLPGLYLHQALVMAGKRLNDPSSPSKRKTAFDLFKGAFFCVDDLYPITSGVTGRVAVWKPNKKAKASEPYTPLHGSGWDHLDKRRCVVMRSAINRKRPRFEAGWVTHPVFTVVAAEYVPPELFREALEIASKLVGLAEMRPTFGRFSIDSFKIKKG
jgi:hypothetical protein